MNQWRGVTTANVGIFIWASIGNPVAEWEERAETCQCGSQQGPTRKRGFSICSGIGNTNQKNQNDGTEQLPTCLSVDVDLLSCFDGIQN